MNCWRSIFALVLLTAALAAGAGAPTAPLQAQAADERALITEEVRALARRAIANQHRHDAEIMEFERRERRLRRSSADTASVVEDKTFRVVPTGTGTLRLVIEEKGQPVYPNFYEQQLRDLEQALLDATERRSEPRQRRAIEKWEQRKQERYDLVEAIQDAFRATWLGREALPGSNGRRLVKLRLEPNPEFKPRTRIAGALQCARVTVWVDEASAELVRAEADIFRDISFGGGLFGKVYRGGRFVIEQAEAAPGVWLPTRYQLDYTGRKFIFSFGVHETIEIREYRRIGKPAEALAAIRREMAARNNAKAGS
jgi:hypothetical protein